MFDIRRVGDFDYNFTPFTCPLMLERDSNIVSTRMARKTLFA